MKCCEYGCKLLQEITLFIYTWFVKLLHLGMGMFYSVVACCHYKSVANFIKKYLIVFKFSKTHIKTFIEF